MSKLALTTAAVCVAIAASGCSPETRCVRGIDGASDAIKDARDSREGLAKASPTLMKASALVASAEVARAAKEYDACISRVAEAQEAVDQANGG